MKNKRGLIFISSFFGLLSAIPNVLAYTYQGEGLMGGIEKDLLKTIENILAYEIRLPGWGPLLRSQVVPLWSIVLVFTLVYSVVFVLVRRIDIFQTDEGKKAATAFAIAASLFSILGTRLPSFIYKLFNMWVGILVIIGVGLAFWFIYHWVWDVGVGIRATRIKKITNNERIIHNSEVLRSSLKDEKKVIDMIRKELGLLEKKDIKFNAKLQVLINLLPRMNLLLRDSPKDYKEVSKRLRAAVGDLINLKKTMRTPNKVRENIYKLSSLSNLMNSVSQVINKYNKTLTTKRDKILIKEFKTLENNFTSFNNYFLQQLKDTENLIENGDITIINLLKEVSNDIESGNITEGITKLKRINKINGEAMNALRNIENDIDRLEKYESTLKNIVNSLEKRLKITISYIKP